MKSKRTKAIQNVALRSCTLLLLFFYIAGTTPFDILHQFTHPHELTIDHTDETEKDPCHRAIYHNDKQGCSHDSHFTPSMKCSICDLACHSEHIAVNAAEAESAAHGDNSFTQYKASLNAYCAVISSSRAPPFLL